MHHHPALQVDVDANQGIGMGKLGVEVADPTQEAYDYNLNDQNDQQQEHYPEHALEEDYQEQY